MNDAPEFVPAFLVVPATQDVSEHFYAMHLVLVCYRDGEFVGIGTRAVCN